MHFSIIFLTCSFQLKVKAGVGILAVKETKKTSHP